MYEFRLKYVKYNILGILGTPVPIHLGLVPVQVAFCWPVPVQVGRVPVQVGLWWAVPVQPCTCTGTPSGICLELFLFATFCTKTLHTTSIIHNTLKINMEMIQNNFTTLELVMWNSYYKTLGENPRTFMNLIQGPPILPKTI